MRKAIIAVVVLLVLLAGAGAGGIFYVGGQAEQRFDAALQRFSSPPSMVLKKVRYERRLLGADAESSLDIAIGAQTLSIPFKHTISYMPLASGLAEVQTELVVPPLFKPGVDKVFGGASPLTGTTVLNFDGTEVTQFQSPAVTVKDPIANITWQGITGTLTVDGMHVVFKASAPGLKAEGPVGSGSLLNLSFDGDMTQGADEIWLGKAGFQVGKLSLTSPLTPGFEAEGFRIASDSAEQGPGLLRSKVSMDLKKLTVLEMAFSNMGYEIELGNLDRATLVQITKMLEKAQAAAGVSATAPNLDTLFGDGMKYVQQLLKRSPKLTIKRLGAVTPWGDFKTNAALLFDGKGELPAEPMQWLDRLSLDAKLDISNGLFKWLVEQQLKGRTDLIANLGDTPLEPAAAQQLATQMAAVRVTRLEQSGAVVAASDRYTVEVTFKEGRFALNGKDPQAIAALMD